MSASETRECPFCAETIKAAARLCRFCGRDLPLPDPSAVPAPVLAPAPAVGSSGPAVGLRRSELFELLTALVEKSLVIYEEDEQGGGRYRLLETVRQYSRDRLLESGEILARRSNHLRYYLALAEEAEPAYVGPDVSEWVRRLEPEHENFRAALEWALQAAGEESLRLAGALANFWVLRGHLTEGQQRLAAALGSTAPDASTSARARALAAGSSLAYFQGDFARLGRLAEEALAAARLAGDRRTAAVALYELALHYEFQVGDHARATALAEESLATARGCGEEWVAAIALDVLGAIALYRGDLGPAKFYLEECLALCRAIGGRWLMAWPLWNLSLLAQRGGELAQAARLCREKLRLHRELGDPWGALMSLELLAMIAAAGGQAERAARLLGATEAAGEAIHALLPNEVRADHERTVTSVRAALAPEAFAAAWAEGRGMWPSQAVAEALQPAEGDS